jgi:hypothetical protein
MRLMRRIRLWAGQLLKPPYRRLSMFLLRKPGMAVFTVVCVLLAGGGLVVLPLQAQSATSTTTTSTTTTSTTTTSTPKPTPIASFDTFLDANPSIEKDLKQNPSLLNDATYLANHPGLKAFLNGNATISAAAAKDPKALMNRLERFEKSGRDIPKAELAAFDKFLDQNPSIEKDIRKNPSLLTNATYLANHPELQAFLAANPDIQQEITEHPRAFMNAENHFEHHEDKIEHPQAKVDHPNALIQPIPHPMGRH